MKVLFVGDKPSPNNIDPNVAFIGTPSYKTLQLWIKELDLNDFMLLNSNTSLLLDYIYYHWLNNVKIIALGNNAAKRINSRGIHYYKLPHPSPKNRKLNDKRFVKQELLKCKEYIRYGI